MNELPRGWAEARLDELAEVRLGRQRSPKNHSGSRMRPYLRAANVRWSGLDLEDVKEMNFTEEESAVYELRPGDVLVAEASGSADEVGKPAVWRGEIDGCCFQNTLIRVRTLGPVPKYLRYFLLGEAQSGRIGRASPGVGIHHIGTTRLAAWRVPVPPLAEQRRVVAAIEEHLSRLDAAMNTLQSARARIDLARSAFLHAAFSNLDASRPLDELTDSKRPTCYGILKPRTTGQLVVPYVEVRSIRHGRVDVGSLHRTTLALHNEFARSTLSGGDVVMAIRGSWDRAAVVPPELEGANVSRDVARIAPGSRLNPQFLALFLASPLAGRYFASVARGVGVRGVNIADLRRLPVPCPSPGAQEETVARIEAALTALTAASNAVGVGLRQAEALRRSILFRAFRGELVPQDPDDEPAKVLLERITAERAAGLAPTRKQRLRTPA